MKQWVGSVLGVLLGVGSSGYARAVANLQDAWNLTVTGRQAQPVGGGATHLRWAHRLFRCLGARWGNLSSNRRRAQPGTAHRLGQGSAQ